MAVHPDGMSFYHRLDKQGQLDIGHFGAILQPIWPKSHSPVITVTPARPQVGQETERLLLALDWCSRFAGGQDASSKTL